MFACCALYTLQYATKTFRQVTVTCGIVSMNIMQERKMEVNPTKQNGVIYSTFMLRLESLKKFNYLPNLTNCINVVEMVFGCEIFQCAMQ